jgi:hypothetical protein
MTAVRKTEYDLKTEYKETIFGNVDDLINAGSRYTNNGSSYLEGKNAINLGLLILKLRSPGYDEEQAELAVNAFKENANTLIHSKYFAERQYDGDLF